MQGKIGSVGLRWQLLFARATFSVVPLTKACAKYKRLSHAEISNVQTLWMQYSFCRIHRLSRFPCNASVQFKIHTTAGVWLSENDIIQRNRERRLEFWNKNVSVSAVPTGSPSRGGDATGYAFDINQPSLPSPFYSVLASVFVFTCGSFTVFHSINSPDNSPLSYSVLPALFLPYRSFQLYISLRKSPSALI